MLKVYKMDEVDNLPSLVEEKLRQNLDMKEISMDLFIDIPFELEGDVVIDNSSFSKIDSGVRSMKDHLFKYSHVDMNKIKTIEIIGDAYDKS